MIPAESLDLKRSAHIHNMQTLFAENMLAFQEHMKPIYDFFLDYTPHSVKIDMDDNGYLNLKQNDTAIYPGDPKTAHKQQFELYLTSPRHFRFVPKVSTPIKGRLNFLHSHYLSRIDNLGQSALKIAGQKNPRFIPTLALLGIGMGYHLELLHEHFDIQNLVIYEPNPDVFYASLFLINFKPLLEFYTRNSNSITIKVDGTPGEFCNDISNLAIKRGTFTISRIYLYRHYNSSVTDEAFELIHNIAHRLMQGWGFPEDEMMSLAHTAINTAKTMQFIRNEVKPNALPRTLPAFVVANGPSLDKDIEYLKAHQDSAVIFSAGSTLVTLYNAGITPDFQIDIERSRGVGTVVEDLPLSYREKVTFLTLNTTHPAVIALFPKHAFCPKANDSGTKLISKYIPADCGDALTHCNPFSGNGALAFALRLGFKDIVFFGLDMGSVDKTQHHASKSSYYTPGHKQFKQGSANDFILKRPCNRGGDMYTSELLDFSRFAIEGALASMPDINARNCSTGLEIQFCSVTESNLLELENKPDEKRQLIANITDHQFIPVDQLSEHAKRDLAVAVQQTHTLAQQLIECIDDAPNCIRDALGGFSKQLATLEQVQNTQPIAAQMWRGALRYLHCNIGTWLVSLNEEHPEAKRYMERTATVMRDYLSSVATLFQDKYEIPFGDHDPEEYLTEEFQDT